MKVRLNQFKTSIYKTIKGRVFGLILLSSSLFFSGQIKAEEDKEDVGDYYDIYSQSDYAALYLSPDSDEWLTADETKLEPVSGVDAAHRYTGSQVRKAARWVDSFFNDPNYTADEADGRVVFNMSGESSYKDSEEFRMKISGNLTLPGISERLELVFEGNDDLDINDNEDQTFADAAEKGSDNPSVGLRYSLLRSELIDARVITGVRFNNRSVFAGPRVKITKDLSEYWLIRLTQHLRWYTNDGWKSTTDLDFDRRVRKYSLFRQKFRTEWNEDEYDDQGFRHSATTSFTHPLVHKAAMRYSWNSVYLSRLDGGWRSTRFTASYRRALWRDWTILEVAPFVSFDDEYNWEPNPGIKVGISLIFEAEDRTAKRSLRNWGSMK